jgi:hypothetical protein
MIKSDIKLFYLLINYIDKFNLHYVGFEVLTVVTGKVTLFWDVTLCNPLKVYWHFPGTLVNFQTTQYCVQEDSDLNNLYHLTTMISQDFFMKGGECFEKLKKCILELTLCKLFSLSNDYFSRAFPTEILYACLVCLIWGTSPNNLILLYFHVSYAININFALFIINLIKYSCTEVYFCNHPIYLERGM